MAEASEVEDQDSAEAEGVASADLAAVADSDPAAAVPVVAGNHYSSKKGVPFKNTFFVYNTVI